MKAKRIHPASSNTPLTPQAAWARLEQLGRELDRAWKSRRTSTAAIAKMRR